MDDTGWHITNCARKAVATEDGKPVCWQHSKAAIEQRRSKSKERFEAGMADRLAPYKEAERLRAINAALLAALEAGVDGVHDWEAFADWQTQARAAIAEAKEEG
jgi:hypothetical protein